ncbi:MAG: hypothetical protein JWQ86_27 [Mycobacterium sp.]|nr:hypothetical protein [Mycobacterium sp.]
MRALRRMNRDRGTKSRLRPLTAPALPTSGSASRNGYRQRDDMGSGSNALHSIRFGSAASKSKMTRDDGDDLERRTHAASPGNIIARSLRD